MRQSTLLQAGTPHTHHDRLSLLQAEPPRWVTVGMPSPQRERIGAVDVSSAGDLTLLTTVIGEADAMDAAALEAAVSAAYEELGATLRARQRSAIRLWNYLPNPAATMAPELDRYMVFNAGRHRGYQTWAPPSNSTGSSLPTASAVGLESSDLTVQCLASVTPGRSIENPRQRPAWQYSSRYGPKPPSFSRATVATVGPRRQLLIAGTASIVGEDSMHIGDLAGQLDETFANLTSLIANAVGVEARPAVLRRLTDVRVYVPNAADVPAIAAAVGSRCAGAACEMVAARLCRPELLVEIEGIAELE